MFGAGKKIILRCALFIGGMSGAVTAQATTLAISTFDTGLDGWTSNTPAEISWQSLGGNPDGYVRFGDLTANGTYIYAPAAFLGNYLSLGVNSISFDVNIFAETGVSVVGPYEVDLSGPGGAAHFFGTQPSTSYPTGWITVDASITNAVSAPSGWTVTSGTWLGLLGNVTQLGIPIELVTNVHIPGDTDFEGIDRVTLSGTATPEPSVVLMLTSGLLSLGVLRKIRQ